jgi:hypothetical protein
MTRGREQRTAPILSHGQTTSGQCGFNQAASHPADPIKRHRARRERSHPKAMLTTQTSAVALDLLENSIGPKRTIWRADLWLCRRCSAVSKFPRTSSNEWMHDLAELRP